MNESFDPKSQGAGEDAGRPASDVPAAGDDEECGKAAAVQDSQEPPASKSSNKTKADFVPKRVFGDVAL